MPTIYPSDQGYSSFPATLPPYVGAVMVCRLFVNNRLHHNETSSSSLKRSSMVRTFESSLLQFNSLTQYQKIPNRTLFHPFRHMYLRP